MCLFRFVSGNPFLDIPWLGKNPAKNRHLDPSPSFYAEKQGWADVDTTWNNVAHLVETVPGSLRSMFITWLPVSYPKSTSANCRTAASGEWEQFPKWRPYSETPQKLSNIHLFEAFSGACLGGDIAATHRRSFSKNIYIFREVKMEDPLR